MPVPLLMPVLLLMPLLLSLLLKNADYLRAAA
jgi:hypothetical protein